MASAIPPILVEIKANVDGLQTGMAQAQQAIDKIDDNVKNASAGMGNFIGRLKQVGAAMGVTFAATGVASFITDTINAASDMNETMSKSNVVFGQSAKAVQDWSKNAATAMGMSQQQALESAATYGNLFQALGVGHDKATTMSTRLVQLAADLASFNNASPEETLQALKSGLSGETEPLKRFGIALNDATLKQQALAMHLISSTKDALTPAVKAQATYALVIAQTQAAKDDYARTADGVANKQRTLAAQLEDTKAKIGAGLLPVWRILLAVLQGGVLPALSMVGTFLANNKEAVVAFTTVLLAGAAAWGLYELWVKRAAIQQAIMNAVMDANPIGLVVAALAALAAVFVVVWNRSETFRNAMVKLFQIVVNGVGYLVGAIGKLLEAASHIPFVGDKFKGVAATVNKVANDVRSFSDGLSKMKNTKITFGADASGVTAALDKIKLPASLGGTGTGSGSGSGSGSGTADKKYIPGTAAWFKHEAGSTTYVYNITTTANSNASPKLIADSTVAAIKYGVPTTITVPKAAAK